MANMIGKTSVKEELRTCKVKGEKALFHKWFEKSRIVDPSPMIGGHSGGIIKYPVAIIEYLDGDVIQCNPEDIKFTDSKSAEYFFGD